MAICDRDLCPQGAQSSARVEERPQGPGKEQPRIRIQAEKEIGGAAAAVGVGPEIGAESEGGAVEKIRADEVTLGDESEH